MEAAPWIVRARTLWRDLPEAFGKWGSVWRRFRLWMSIGAEK